MIKGCTFFRAAFLKFKNLLKILFNYYFLGISIFTGFKLQNIDPFCHIGQVDLLIEKSIGRQLLFQHQFSGDVVDFYLCSLYVMGLIENIYKIARDRIGIDTQRIPLVEVYAVGLAGNIFISQGKVTGR